MQEKYAHELYRQWFQGRIAPVNLVIYGLLRFSK